MTSVRDKNKVSCFLERNRNRNRNLVFTITITNRHFLEETKVSRMFQSPLLLCSLLVALTASTVNAFSPIHTAASSQACTVRTNDGLALSMATKKKKKKKPSMAERRQRRQKKSLGGPNPYEGLPSPKLDFSSGEDEAEEAPIKVANPEAAAEKAKELLKAQRDSVNMLTLVKDKIMDKFTDMEFRTQLETNGFAVVDGFFGKDDDSEETSSVLDQLGEEAATMLAEGEMEVDTANLGKGQYVVPIGGGEKQYAMCPRMVEIVVSGTKNIPLAFGEGEEGTSSDEDTEKPSILELDDAASMATLRSFDRKALKASLQLLRGSEDDSALDSVEDETPFAVVASDPATDKRRLSVHYYIVPSAWDEGCGGGLVFENGTRVAAQNDRVVVFYSDKANHKSIPWKGSDESPELAAGNAIELHLIEKRQ